MSSIETKPAFLDRFDSIWSKMRRTHIGQAICWVVVIAVVGFSALVALDYWLEVGRNDRAVGLGVVAVVSLVLAATWIYSALRRWSRPKTATEIEERFPELGQAVRTSVEFGSRSAEALGNEGVQPALVSALAADTEQRAAPLQIDSIVPVKRLWLAAGLACVVILIMLAGVAVNWEWRVATLRALLGDQAYTELTISPGHLTVEEGDALPLSIDIAGRTNRNVILATRSLDSEEGWVERELTAADVVSSQPRLIRYETTLNNMFDSLEYRVLAGSTQSETYRIDVRHPLAIESIRADVTPPAYTGLEPSTLEKGSWNVIDGSTIRVNITLDRPPTTAMMILTERGVRLGPGERPKVEEIPLTIDGAILSTTLEPRQDQTYAIVAQASDGMQLPANKFRIRVRYDQPPKIWFEEPSEVLEVHSIAEVLLRVRFRDDFGMSRAGIVFEVNNEQEYFLRQKDYIALAAELEAAGQTSEITTRDALQRLLPLELFDLEEKDSVTYYGFAEDNFPGAAHRSETDLRFIDIRPFRRIYHLPTPSGQGGGNNNNNLPQVRSLQQIIARQRFNLNRTIRLDRNAKSGSEPTLVEVDRAATFEDELSKSTHELAEFLDEREFDGSDLLFQAETVMLTAVDSLNVSKYYNSAQQQKDALRLLIEGRNTLEKFLRTATAAQRNAVRNFSRQQTQRLRQGKQNKKDEEDPETLVRRIRRLADEQEFVYKTLSSGGGGGGQENAQSVDAEGGESQSEKASGDGGDDGDEPEQDMEDSENDDTSSEMSREQIEQRQQDLAVEARDVETILNRLRDASDLVRERASAVADAADQVSGELSRGSTDDATETARQTSAMLRELALNVEGVLSSEVTQNISMARDLAGMVAALQRRLAVEADPDDQDADDQDAEGSRQSTEDEDDENQRGGGVDENEEELDDARLAELARRAARLGETGRTMKDILDAAVERTSPREREAVRRLNEVLSTGEVDETVERMTEVERMLEERRGRDARVESEDIADRLDVLARELDQVYRSIVTPRLEQLMALEDRAVQARDELQALETNEQISTWHRHTLELTEDLDKAKAVGDSLDQLDKAMEAEGWSKMTDRRRWNWKRGENDNYVPPPSYSTAMRAIIEEIQQQMQELILTDLVADDNEATPPKYQHLVDEYMKVLSSDVGAR